MLNINKFRGFFYVIIINLRLYMKILRENKRPTNKENKMLKLKKNTKMFVINCEK